MAHVSTVVAAAECTCYERGAVDAAVGEAVALAGGLGACIRPGNTVLIKPNLLSPRPPAEAVTTHPLVVAALVRQCQDAGAARVWIGDSCAGDHEDDVLWSATGMADVAAETGAELVSFRAVVSQRAAGEGQVPVPGWLADVDAVVSVPKLKTHALTGMTCALKNTYGLVCGNAKSHYHGSHPSPRAMSRFLVDVHRALAPAFYLVDAVTAMGGEGPANGRPVRVGALVAGTDATAVDTVCARAFARGGDVSRHLPMLRAARAMGVGVGDVNAITVCGDGVARLNEAGLKPSIGRWLQMIPEPVFKTATRVLACRPKIDASRCTGCGVCARACSQDAIHRRGEESTSYKIDSAQCIMCMCCAEACPCHAVMVRSPLRVAAAVRDLLRR